MMLYDLEKALTTLNTVYFWTMYSYQSGVNAQMWRLVKSWYLSPTNRVRLGGHGGQLSDLFEIQRGV